MVATDEYAHLKLTTAIVAVRPYVWLKQVPREQNYESIKNFSDLVHSMVNYPSKAVAHQTCANAYYRSELHTVSHQDDTVIKINNNY